MRLERPVLRVIITGGGTGGHLFPALAVAEQFVSRFSDCKVLFVGTGRYMDAQVLQGSSFESKQIRCGALKGGTLTSRLKTLLLLPVGLCQAMAIIRKFKPDLVFGVGGYVTAPVLVAARIMGVATCLHEQNSVPGMANRKLGSIVNQVFLSIPGSEKYFPPPKCFLSGNPVRKEFLERGAAKESSAAQRTADFKKVTLQVVGGSQGAHKLNRLVPAGLITIRDELPGKFQVVHQTGKADFETVQKAYNEAGIKAQVRPFFDNMAELLERADLVVCRAGATTLAELTVLSKPSILIPFPYAADDHQTKNGEFLVQGGAAQMFKEDKLDEKVLGKAIGCLLQDINKRSEMGRSAGRLAKPEAAEIIVDKCLKLTPFGTK